MQHTAAHYSAPSRRRSPAHSDEEGDVGASLQQQSSYAPAASSTGLTAANISPTASTSTSNSTASRAARPHLPQPSGSFVRIKRKTTSLGNVNTHDGVGSSGSPRDSFSLQSPASAVAPSTSSGPGNNASVDSATTHDSTFAHQQQQQQQQQQRTVSRTCFICYEEEEEQVLTRVSSKDALSSSTNSRPRSDSGKRWIHPCQCSLVAHEGCLMQWIASSNPSASTVKPAECPQCKTPYTINQLNFPLLNLVENIENLWARNASKIVVVSVGAGVWTVLGWYGVWAIRMFVGKTVADQILLRKWTKWLTAPLILPVLVLSRTHLLDSILPFLPLTLVLNSTMPASSPLFAVDPYFLSDLVVSYPPNPALTLCLIPWVRALYVALRRRIYQAVLGRRITPAPSPGSPQTLQTAGTPGMPVDLPEEADFRANQQRAHGEAAAAAAAAAEVGTGADFAARFGMEPRRVVITVASSVRLLASSLIFPGMAAATGSLLYWLAKRQNNGRGLLGKILGISLAATASKAATIPPSSMGSLWTFLPPQREYVDPVWWRNTIGGALLIMLKDAASIVRQKMELKRIQSRRIEDKPYRNGVEH